MRNRLPLFLVKLFYYEYWPFWIFFLPLVPYWVYLAVKHRSLTFFTLANPGIPHGGVFGESKADILEKISPEYQPKSVFCSSDMTLEQIQIQLNSLRLTYPFIAKPNVGERGNEVEKILDEAGLQRYIRNNQVDFIIQQFVDYSIELGVLYYRTPLSGLSGITSIVQKEFLAVTGDGESTLLQLIHKNERAKLQLDYLTEKFGDEFDKILPKDEVKELQPIGNHCLGTKFLSANDLINNDLVKVFDQIAEEITGFNYGRFDLKVKSFDSLIKGEDILILELNGVTSEPGHIYDPKLNLFRAYHDTIKSLRKLSIVCKENKQLGYQETSPKEFIQLIFGHFKSDPKVKNEEVVIS